MDGFSFDQAIGAKSDSHSSVKSSNDLKLKVNNYGTVNNHSNSASTNNHIKMKDGHISKSKDSHSSSKHSSSSEKHRDGHSDKPKKSSSSDKHRDGHSDKHKDKHSEKHKDSSKHSSSSSSSTSLDKHGSSSSSKSSSHNSEKHKDRHKEKSSSSSNDKLKEKSKHKPSDSSTVKSEKSSEERKKERSEHREAKPNVVKTEHTSIKSDSKHMNNMSSSKHNSVTSPVSKISPSKIKREPMSDDDIPLIKRKPDDVAIKKMKVESDDEPLQEKYKAKIQAEKLKAKERKEDIENRKRKAEETYEPIKKKKIKKEIKNEVESPIKGRKKKDNEEQQTVWKWWEEERRDDGVKWTFLEHKGPLFAPDYDPLPDNVIFKYDGKVMKLSQGAEEVAGFYAKMLEHDYTKSEIFNKNFFKDWRKVMSASEKETLSDLKKCDFRDMHAFFTEQSEERKNRTKEEKLALKKKNEQILAEYGYCIMDGHKEKIGNFRIEPPGLFRGRGDHPKQGMLKRRTMPEDVIINCSKDSNVPQPPAGHKWKKVQADNKVSWLACWSENIQGQTKYVMLNAASRLKGEKDWQKYEVARRLYKHVDKIRATYREDWKSKEMRIRQRAVALYFIDKLALRAGNEKEEGETADTVGCCSLRVEHIKLHPEIDNKEFVVEFDFLGKDSIRYQNKVPVEKRVFKNLQLFMENKQPGDDLFDRLNTATLNKHLHDLMEGLTAKVFRTFNASKTLQEQLDLLTNPEESVTAKLLSYNRANRAVAVLCNHQRSVPKNFSKQMENLQNKIKAKMDVIKEGKKQVKDAKSDYKNLKTEKAKSLYEKKKKQLERLQEQLCKLEVQATDKDENKEIALGTSKLNYLDPRISVAWCKKWEAPLEKIYNKTQREKFRWAIDMATPDFRF
ncbi:DNA topoisomerase I, mitochondrial-like [Octopus vulgaris]|uniref:DNA topoisomerase I, mitochondrial-like n=3 Tax=Octopus TaxID=6643 RepID=A0AA36FL53_OCTVU|nr:DNA topoisomerase I, mitochondrial isoform X1 [Octopus sinensis]CAI9738008.1 DNA topoisomerase I, mitochondrial-like [Octopus vulgaris]